MLSGFELLDGPVLVFHERAPLLVLQYYFRSVLSTSADGLSAFCLRSSTLVRILLLRSR